MQAGYDLKKIPYTHACSPNNPLFEDINGMFKVGGYICHGTCIYGMRAEASYLTANELKLNWTVVEMRGITDIISTHLSLTQSNPIPVVTQSSPPSQ